MATPAETVRPAGNPQPKRRGACLHPIVFCDFDGTITQQDTLQALCERFLPERADALLAGMATGRLTLRAGLSELIGSLRSSDADEIVRFVCRQPLRAGFETFLQHMRDRRIPVVVLSSGMRFCIEARLAPWRTLIHAIHALDVDLGGTHMRARLDAADTPEALPKAEIMRDYPGHPKIAIGDSFSDQRMALHADHVFARDRLLTYLRRRRTAALPYRDFHDIIRRFPVSPQPFEPVD